MFIFRSSTCGPSRPRSRLEHQFSPTTPDGRPTWRQVNLAGDDSDYLTAKLDFDGSKPRRESESSWGDIMEAEEARVKAVKNELQR